jgi:hypothetical protein
VEAYEVYVACAVGAAPAEFPEAPTATVSPGAREYTIEKDFGDECAIRIVALDTHGFMSPASEDSDLVRFEQPQRPRIDADLDGSADVVVLDAGPSGALMASGASLDSGDNLGASLVELGTGANPDWTLIATGHFDSDGQLDFLWKINAAEGAPTTTYVAGSAVHSAVVHSTATQDMGEVLVVRDFDGNFLDDIMFYDDQRGYLTCIFTLQGAANETVDFPAVPPRRFEFVTSGDFNGDGIGDLLWRKKTTGQTVAWLMHGGENLDQKYSGAMDPNVWIGEGTGNFNNSKNDDILWRNADTGETRIWYMDNLKKPVELTNVNTKGSKWKLIGAGDVNGDGRAELTWHNLANDHVELWYMDEEAPGGYYGD